MAKVKKLKQLPFTKLHLIFFIAIFACIGGFILLSSHAAGPAVWMSTNGNDSTCVRGDSSKPCLSFTKACSIAQPGDIVLVADGTYAAEKVVGCQSSDPGITFQAQDAHQVYIGAPASSGDQALELANRTTADKWITLDGIDTYTFGVYGPTNGNADWPVGDSHRASHITVKNMTIRNHSGTGSNGSSSPFYADQVDYLTLDSIQIGPVCCNADGADIYPTLSHVTINNFYIHDIAQDCADVPPGEWSNCVSTSTPYSNNHIDCLQFVGGDTITIQNSKLINCAAGTLMNGVNRQKYNNYTLFNNFFQGHVLDMSGGGGAGGSFGYAYTGFVHLYFNDVPDGTNFQDWQPGGDYQMVGNLFGDIPPNHGTCTIEGTNGDSNANFTQVKYNIFDGGQSGTAAACGDPTNINANASYINSSNRVAGIDLHLNNGSPGIDSIPTSFCNGNVACPTTDIDGQTRPIGSAFDMGADEVSSSPSIWVSVTGNDNTCSRSDQTKPCLTFKKACSLVQAGDTIGVQPGNYANQHLVNTDCPNATSSGRVTFLGLGSDTIPSVGAASDAPNIGGSCTDNCSNTLNLGDNAGAFTGATNAPNYLTFKNFKITSEAAISGNQTYGTLGSTGVGDTFDHFSGGAFYLAGAKNATVSNSDFGSCWPDSTHPCRAAQSADFGQGSSGSSTRQASSYTIDNVTFHDYDHNTTNHGECWFSLDWRDQTTIQDSHFYNCTYSGGIRIESNTTHPTGSLLTIQNNWFGHMYQSGTIGAGASDACRALSIGGAPSGGLQPQDILVRYNTFWDGEGVWQGSGTGVSSIRIIGNLLGVAANASCEFATPANQFAGNILYDHNIWVGTAQNANDTTLPSLTAFNNLFVNPAGDGSGDYHLKNGQGLPNSYVPNSGPDYSLSLDKDSNNRTFPTAGGANVYVGSSGSSSGPSIGDLNNDSHVNILDLSIMLSHYGTLGTPSQGDCNNDGTINILDLSILLSYYGI